MKTALLVIEKDFKSKFNYSPLVARPRSIFADEYFLVNPAIEKELQTHYGNYFTKVPYDNKDKSLYRCHLKSLWEHHYDEISFPQFKFLFHRKDPSLNLFFLNEIESVMLIHLGLKSHLSGFKGELTRIVNCLADIFGQYAKRGQYFKVEDVARELQRKLGKDKYYCINLATVTLVSALSWDRHNRWGRNFYNSFIVHDETRGYRLNNSGFSSFFSWVVKQMDRIILKNRNHVAQNQVELYLPKGNNREIEKTFILLGMIEAMGLLIFNVTGGIQKFIFGSTLSSN